MIGFLAYHLQLDKKFENVEKGPLAIIIIIFL